MANGKMENGSWKMEIARFPCFFGGLTTIMRSVLTGIGVPALLDKVAPVRRFRRGSDSRCLVTNFVEANLKRENLQE